MILNLTSRIIINTLIADIESFFQACFKNPKTAISPVMNYQSKFFNYDLISILKIGYGSRSLKLYIFTENFSSEETGLLNEHLKSNIYHSEVILSILFKKKFKVELIDRKDIKNEYAYTGSKKRIDLSVVTGGRELFLSFIIPFEFFRLFSRAIEYTSDSEYIENEILRFFQNPMNIFPNLKIILETFSDIELQKLLFQLQRNNLLTIYQICLIVLSFPQYSLRIKRNLSTNTINDVRDLMRTNEELKFIYKRDQFEGIYSIEEGIYMLMKKEEDFRYSKFLLEIQKGLKILSNSRILLAKKFTKWIEEMISQDLLYQTISITREEDIAISISDNPALYCNILEKYISKSKVDDIHSIIGNRSISFTEKIESKCNFISNYRKIKIRRLNLKYDSFKTLLSRIEDSDEINHLLFGVGWFVLSTALKKVGRKRQLRLIESIPDGAKYLIIDVLQGIVNPNIIHDEIQIKKARAICVREIISLYEDGIIHLSD